MDTEFIQNNSNNIISKVNIDNFEKLEKTLESILNEELGSDWGVISFDTIKRDEEGKILLPQINYTVKLREVSKGKSYKPMLTNVIDELNENKEKTGKAIKVYRQSFDCTLEFKFLTEKQEECRKVMERFEDIVVEYTGFLKGSGLGEIFFLREIAIDSNLDFNRELSIITSEYFIRLDKIKTLHVNKLKSIEMDLYARNGI